MLVLGSKGVGKTTICQKYAGLSIDDTDDIAVTTEGVPYDTSVFIDKDGEVQQYDLEVYDSDREFSPQEYRTEIQKVDGYLLVCTKDSEQSVAKLIDIISDIKHVKSVDAPMLIVCNKSDLKDSALHKEIPSLNLQILDVSAVKNEGLQLAFNLLVEKCVDRKEKLSRNADKVLNEQLSKSEARD